MYPLELPRTGNSKRKDSEAGASLECSRNIKETSVIARESVTVRIM